MQNPTHNFLSWYKMCCELDSGIYRKTIYKKNKAKIIFEVLSKYDYLVYPLNGTQNIFYGSRFLCEEHMQENFNTKFLVFSKKNDTTADYIIENENIKII